MDLAFLGKHARNKCISFLQKALHYPSINQELQQILVVSYDDAFLFSIASLRPGDCEWLGPNSTYSRAVLLSHASNLSLIHARHKVSPLPFNMLVVENLNYFLMQPELLYELFQCLISSVQVLFTSEDLLSEKSLQYLPRFFRSCESIQTTTRYTRPRLVEVPFPVQWMHVFESFNDTCPGCNSGGWEEVDQVNLFHKTNFDEWLCRSCAKKQNLICLPHVTTAYRFQRERCSECKLGLGEERKETALPCPPPFDYYWTISTPSHVGSDFFLLDQFSRFALPKDLWLLIHQYTFFSSAKKTLYLHRRESKNILWKSGVFPSSRRGVLHTKGKDSQGEWFEQYLRYEGIGPLILQLFRDESICCE